MTTSKALVSFKKYMPPPLPYFKVNICPFPLTPLRLNIFRLFVILSLTQLQLYRYSPKIFLFSTATFEYTYRAPLRRIGQEYSANVALYKVHVYVFWTFCWTGNKAIMTVYQLFHWTSNPRFWEKSQLVPGPKSSVVPPCKISLGGTANQ